MILVQNELSTRSQLQTFREILCWKNCERGEIDQIIKKLGLISLALIDLENSIPSTICFFSSSTSTQN
jgi:hypothetical protein